MKSTRHALVSLAFLSALGSAVPALAQGTSFSYQGRLRNNGANVNGPCDFQFKLFDAPAAGNQKGPTLLFDGNTALPIMVNAGLFMADLEFGPAVFDGKDLYLEISVRAPSGMGAYALLGARQKLANAPAANVARRIALPYTETVSSVMSEVFHIINTSPDGNAASIYGETAASLGVAVGALATSANGQTCGVVGQSLSTSGIGVRGFASSANGPNIGVQGESSSPGGRGVKGINTAMGGVAAEGFASSGTGVQGQSSSGVGVSGVSTSGVAVNAFSQNSHGLVAGTGNVTSYAGYFNGNVFVNGTMSANAKQFKIDHPLDPANKYLSHTCVESADMKNIYDGVATLDANGEAWVVLPDWFEALNRDFRYQTTCLDQFAPLYIKHRVTNNRFRIAGGKSGMEVSWQITGIRHDPWSQAHRDPVEEDKAPEARGKYLAPIEHGQPESARIKF